MGKKIIDLAERRQLWQVGAKTVQKPQPVRPVQVQRDEPAPEQDDTPGWARDIPANIGTPTMRKPDKCSGCGTPIWRWYQPDPMSSGEWRCCNCLIYQVKYNKEGALELTLEACQASGIYRDDYLWYEGDEQ